MNDEPEGLRRWANLINERGHASLFARKTAGDKRIVEQQTAAEWALSVRAEFGVEVVDLVLCDADPPDFCGEWQGRRRTVELVELVDGRLLRRRVRERKGGGLPVANTFSEAQWDYGRFTREINRLLDQKQARYATGSQAFDLVVVYSDEPWLRASAVREWLRLTTIQARPAFENAHLLLTYDPSESAHWPLFNLYGELGSDRRDSQHVTETPA